MRLRILFILVLFLGIKHSYSQLYINEIIASNTQTNYDPDFIGFSDWIEIYNAGNSPVSLYGYYLTDDLLVPNKWQITESAILPPGAFFVFWADGRDIGNHTNFKLSSAGEEVGLANASGSLIDSFTYPPQSTDVSYGRKYDEPGLFGFFYKPTPGSANTTLFLEEIVYAGTPVFSISGGIYPGPVNVELATSSPTAEIRFTIDGSYPDENSPVYSTAIQTSDTVSIIRARVFEDGIAPGAVVSNTYFANVSHELPILSITTDPDNLWNDTIGIYCVGTHGIQGYGGITANYWHTDWERPVNLEMFETDGEQVINQQTGIAINGARRNMAQKSLRVFARGKYGKPSIDHGIFKSRKNEAFSSLVLRNSGLPDFESTLIRDGLSQSLTIGRMGLEYQGYRQAVLYLNGVYWGIYNIREKQNEDYLKDIKGANPMNVNMLEYVGEVIEGSNEDYLILREFMEQNDLNTETNFNYLKSKIDIDDFINYQIAEIYMGNYDWPGLNIKYWNENKEDSKWRWLLYDIDVGFGLWGGYNFNSLEHATATDGPNWPNPPSSTLFFRQLLTIDDFRNEFIQRFAAHINTTFVPGRIIPLADSLAQNIAPEMPVHINRWKDHDSPDGVCPQTLAEWEENLTVINEYAVMRPQKVFGFIKNKFNLLGTFKLSTNAVHGHIEINTVAMPEGPYSGNYFKLVPLRLKAVPDIGYEFAGWLGVVNGNKPELELELYTDASITAIFMETQQSVLPQVIDEDMALTSDQSPYFAYGDVVVDSNVTLSIEAGVEIRMPESACINVYGQLLVNGTEEEPIVITVNKDIGDMNWGALCFYNPTDSSYINNLEINSASQGRIDTLQLGAISAYNTKLLVENSRIEDSYQPFYSEGGQITIQDCVFRTDKTADLINVKYSDYAWVDNCDLKGNEAPDVDGIDFDEVENGIISNNKIYGFYGFNSDGIDIGEAAQNVIIENNVIFNCNDKGVSVGQQSSVILKRNLIYNCGMGVGVKDSLSYAYIDQNTFYNNNYAVICFEKNYKSGGGNAEVINSILANSVISPLFVDSLSSLTASWSLSDTEEIPGEGNLEDDPLFMDTDIMNFQLLPQSPCINAGNPESPPDPDGSVADMGAYVVFDTLQPDYGIVITEINYHSDTLMDSGDWIELYNNSDVSVDLSGWIFMDSEDDNRYAIAEGISLDPEEYIVFSNDRLKFSTINSSVTNYRGNFLFGLNRTGEKLRLFDTKMQLVDLVEYDNELPWPVEPDGNGPTLQLTDPSLDNNMAENWTASELLGGTPGYGEYGTSNVPERLSDLLVYPNPTSNYFFIKADHLKSKPITIEIYDTSGRRVFFKETIYFSKIAIEKPGDIEGLYFLKITEGNGFFVEKLVFIK
ncbi:MAG: T9SS type A sorting domain-containing protein [Chlorobi bacterium]|nr:T9SS type A sorting domain-containing protein [Chlorobiota bacterium]